MELAKVKKGIFCTVYFVRWKFFNIYVLSQCTVYWIHFQNIYTFTYQKTLIHTLLPLVFKIIESLHSILKLIQPDLSDNEQKRKCCFSRQILRQNLSWILSYHRKMLSRICFVLKLIGILEIALQLFKHLRRRLTGVNFC